MKPIVFALLVVASTTACTDGGDPAKAPGAVLLGSPTAPSVASVPAPVSRTSPNAPLAPAPVSGTCPWGHADNASLKNVEARTGIPVRIDCVNPRGLDAFYRRDLLNRYLPKGAEALEHAIAEIDALPIKPADLSMSDHYDDLDWNHLRVFYTEHDSTAEWFRQVGLFQKASRDFLRGEIRVTAYEQATQFLVATAPIERRIQELPKFASALLKHADQVRAVDVSVRDAYSAFAYDPVNKVAKFDGGEFTKDYGKYLDFASRYGRLQDRVPNVGIRILTLDPPITDAPPLGLRNKALDLVEKLAEDLQKSKRTQRIMIIRGKSNSPRMYFSEGQLQVELTDMLGFETMPVERVRACLAQIEEGGGEALRLTLCNRR